MTSCFRGVIPVLCNPSMPTSLCSTSVASGDSRLLTIVFRLTILLWAILWFGCSSRIDIPDMGPRLAQTASLELSESLVEAKADYSNNCGNLRVLNIGTTLEDVLTETTHRTFQSVVRPGSDVKPDIQVRVKLVQSSFVLLQDAVYDRAPVELVLGGLASYYDSSGALLGEDEIVVTRKDRVRLEPTQKNCDYIIDPFVHNTSVEFATKFSLSAHARFGTQASVTRKQESARPENQSKEPALAVTPAVSGSHRVSSAISFKATVLDENGNLVFEGGERVRVRVDLVNTGEHELQDVKAVLTGTPVLLAQFPTTTLPAGRLQPGQSRSLEFVATLPQSVQAQKVEIQVSVIEGGTEPAPPQILSLPIQPTGVTADDVDQVPAAATGFKKPQTYLLSIGIGSYRDAQLSLRKYGAADAEIVSTYFQSLGGLPASNVRLLQDWKALRPDIEEALLDWLPARVNRDAVVIVYFAGLAIVSTAGEVYLVPYDGNSAGTSRALPLKDLEAALSRLKVKQTILLFDGTVTRLGSDSRPKGIAPQWNPSGSASLHIISTNGVARAIEDDKHRHGLFTYYLLRALRGESDINRDGEVTLAEALSYLSQKVAWASKSQYGQEQRPVILPPLKAGDATSLLVLTKLAVITSAEAR